MTSGIEASNTVETLTPRYVEEVVAETQVNGDPSEADLDAEAAEEAIKVATTTYVVFEDVETLLAVEAPAPVSEFVSRAEFDELLGRINKFNRGAPHKI